MALPESETEFQKFILRFETGTLPKEEWHHSDHVAMAFWHLIPFNEETAIEKIRLGIQHLNSKHGIPPTPSGGYHETWTIFFSKIIHRYILQKLDRTLPLIQQLNGAIEHLADFKKVTLQYYSRDVIMSWEARTSWREPDLKAL